MARTETLVNLRTRARQRGGFEGNTSLVSDSELTGLVNESIADLLDILARARGTDQNETTQSYTTTQGVSTYALGATFYELLAVEYYDGFNRYELNVYHKIEHPYLSDTNVGWTGYPYFYRLTGSNIDILPAPNSSAHSFTLRFNPAAVKLVNESDTLDGINGWEEYVVVDAARKMATKARDQMLVNELKEDRERLRERIKALAGKRDRHLPRRVVDVRYGRVETMGRKRVPR